MHPEFRKQIKKIKSLAEEPIPRLRFSRKVRSALTEEADSLDYFEAMTILLEKHPFFPFKKELTFGKEINDYRRALAYEIIIRALGHCRSLVANANAFNHIGTGVALRCMLELYAFLIYLKNTKCRNDLKLLDKLLHGSIFSSGDWYEYENVWKKNHEGVLPEKYKEFFKSFLKTPHVSEYLKSTKFSDKGFDYMYAIYSNFVHPTFGRPRDVFMEDMGREASGDAFEDYEYYVEAKEQSSPLKTLSRDISAAGFCLQLTWPEVLSLDPLFDEELGIFNQRSDHDRA